MVGDWAVVVGGAGGHLGSHGGSGQGAGGRGAGGDGHGTTSCAEGSRW